MADDSAPVIYRDGQPVGEASGDEVDDEKEDEDLDEQEVIRTQVHEAELEAAVKARQVAETAAPSSGFIIAVTSRKVRRFHHVGSSGKVPG